MTTRAKRDKKKVNRAKGKAFKIVADLLDSPPGISESEHAAAMTALAAAKRFKKKLEKLWLRP